MEDPRVTEPGICDEQGRVSQEALLGINAHENRPGMRRFMEPYRGKEFKTPQS